MPYTINITQVSVGEAFKDRLGSSNIRCNIEPIIPCASIIQNNIKDPINGVTIIGSKDTKIVGPFIVLGKLFTPNAIKNPKNNTKGVTTNV